MTLSLLAALLSQPALGERISFKLGYRTNNISGNDINTWIDSFNLLWKDYQGLNGGDLQGQFTPISFSGGLDLELRITLYKGLALNLAGGYLSSSEEGTTSFQHASGTQSEEQYISNKVTAVPLKIGFSYAFVIPPFPRLSLVAGLGRHILFVSYDSTNNYASKITDLGKEFNYLINKKNEYSSESLGYYAHLGAEMEIFKFLAVVLEGEKVWNQVDGFKGPFIYEAQGFPPESITQSGKASLYFYESDHIGSGTYYTLLSGHKNTPADQLEYPLDSGSIEGPLIRNVRQGMLDFDHISIKIGIRFKF